MIDAFEYQFAFLSNFHAHPVLYCGVTYRSVEHGYQAAKMTTTYDHDLVRDMPTPGQAKRAGRTLKRREDWDDVKVGVMRDLLVAKFKDRALRNQLIATHPHELVEGNTWGDTFWGVCKGAGQNHLGRLLMDVRADCIKAVTS